MTSQFLFSVFAPKKALLKRAKQQLKIPAASCRESSTVRNAVFFMIRSLTPPQAAGNALAFAVQIENDKNFSETGWS
jgi:hypothetical protein